MPYVFTDKLKHVVSSIFGEGHFVVKSIYFDKPGLSNWFVAYHQDLTISVTTNTPVEGFTNFTVKQGQYAVQPPMEILRDNFTVRIHLDDTDEFNGALKVIAGSHKNGIIKQSGFNFSTEAETVCTVKSGGIMIMKPLLLHASARTVNNKRRRVIHIEFSKEELPAPLQWGEKEGINW